MKTYRGFEGIDWTRQPWRVSGCGPTWEIVSGHRYVTRGTTCPIDTHVVVIARTRVEAWANEIVKAHNAMLLVTA